MFGIFILRVSPDGSTLTVIRANPADSGKYTCVATNAAGEEGRIFNLNVYGGFISFFKFTPLVASSKDDILFFLEDDITKLFPFANTVPPVILGNNEAASDLTTVLDSSVNIECVATGYPLPQLNWLRNGLPLPVSSNIQLLSAGQMLR